MIRRRKAKNNDDLRVQILEARPGDIVCLVSDSPLSMEAVHRVEDLWAAVAPEGVKVAVLDGLRVDKVIRPDDDNGSAGPDAVGLLHQLSGGDHA